MRHLLIIGIILGIFSCKKTEKKDSYYYLDYDYERYSAATVDTLPVIISQIIKDSVYNLKYILNTESDIDSISYTLKEDTNFKPNYVVNNKYRKKEDFQFVEKNEFSINSNSFVVYKYACDAKSIDGCVTHFWTPKLGVFLIRSTTWRRMKILYSTNIVKNETINSLCRLIWQKPDFYFGGAEKMKLIRESLTKKDYKVNDGFNEDIYIK